VTESEATPAALLNAADLEELERTLQRSTGRATRVGAIPPPEGQKRKPRRGRVTIPTDEVPRAPQPPAPPAGGSWIALRRPLDLDRIVDEAFARRPAPAVTDFAVDIEIAAGVPAPADEPEAPPITEEPEYANPTLIEVADQEPVADAPAEPPAPPPPPQPSPPPPPPPPAPQAAPPPPVPTALRIGFGAPEEVDTTAPYAPVAVEELLAPTGPAAATEPVAAPPPPVPAASAAPDAPGSAAPAVDAVAEPRPVPSPPAPPGPTPPPAAAEDAAARPIPPPIPAGRGTPTAAEDDGRTPPPIPAVAPRLRATSGEISVPPPVPRIPPPGEPSVASEPVIEDATEPESSLAPLIAVTAEAAPATAEAEGAHGPPALPAEPARKPRKPKKFKKPWFEEFFDDDFLKTIPGVTPVFTAKEARYIQRQLALEKGAHVLDVGCGYGRQSVEFARAGYQVTGLDTSLPLLIQAAEAARAAEVDINFMHLDMRELSAQDEYDGAFCVMTSFGYFEDDANADVIRRVCAALKPGGRFFLEVINRDFILPDLPSRVWWEGDECLVMDEVDFNYLTSRITTSRSVVFNDGRSVNHELSIRAYCLHELGRLLHASGFRVLSVTGNMNTEGRFFGIQSSHLVIVSEKPRAL
jgi:SAM-dependent methyltransferase